MKQLRERANLTQMQLAHAVNVSMRTINEWEKGRGEPRLEHIKLLLDTLNCSFEELYEAFKEAKERALNQELHESLERAKRRLSDFNWRSDRYYRLLSFSEDLLDKDK